MRPKGSAEELFHYRQRAIELLEQGISTDEVARCIGVDRRSVRRWHSSWRQEGEAALMPKPVRGAPPSSCPSRRPSWSRPCWMGPRPPALRANCGPADASRR